MKSRRETRESKEKGTEEGKEVEERERDKKERGVRAERMVPKDICMSRHRSVRNSEPGVSEKKIKAINEVEQH